MIQPEGIPVEAVFSAAAGIAQSLGPLDGLGPRFAETGAHINTEFKRLNNCYQAPEREQLVHSTQRIQDSLGEFGPKLPQVAHVLSGLAEQLRGLAVQLRDLRARAYAWQAKKNQNPDWQNDQWMIDENNNLIGAVSMILTGDAGGGTYAGFVGPGSTIPASALEAANKIAALYGGRRWQANGQHEGDAPLPGPPPPTEAERQKMVDDILHGKFPPPPPPAPWGAPEERDYPWYQDVGHFLAGVGEGILTGLGEAAQGLLTLVPVLPALASIPGVRDWAKDKLGWDMPTWKDSRDSWKGLGTLGAAIVLSPMLLTNWAISEITGKDGSPQWMKDLRETGVNAAKGFVAWDEWGKNPGKAFGMVLTNVVTTVAGGGVITEAKAASMASKFGKAAPVVAKGIDAVNYLRGTRAAMHDATLGLAMKIPKVSSVVEGLSKIPIVGGTFRMQNTPKIDVPGTHGHGGTVHPEVELPTGHTSVPVTHVPAVEPVTTPTHPGELTTPRNPSRTEPGSPQDPTTTPPGSTPPGFHPETAVPPPLAPIPGTRTPPLPAPIGRTDPTPTSPAGRTNPGTTTPAGRTNPGTTTPAGGIEPGTTTPGGRTEPGVTTPGGRTEPGTTAPGGRTEPGTSSRPEPGSRTPEARTDPGSTPDPSSSKSDVRPTERNDPAKSTPDPARADSTTKPGAHRETSPDPSHTERSRPEPNRTEHGTPDPTSTIATKHGPPQTVQSTPDPTRTGQGTSDPMRTGQGTSDPMRTGEGTPDPMRTETAPSSEKTPARAGEPGTAGRTADPVVAPPVVPPSVAPAHAGGPSGAASDTGGSHSSSETGREAESSPSGSREPAARDNMGRDAAGRDGAARGRIPDTLDGRRPTLPERLDGDPVAQRPRQAIPDRLAGKEPTIPERLAGVEPPRGRTPHEAGTQTGGTEPSPDHTTREARHTERDERPQPDEPRVANQNDPAAPPHDPAARPQVPAARPQVPAARPQDPAARPQDPAARPQDPAARPQDPAARPQDPAARPQDPAAPPHGPAVPPHGPAARPHDRATPPHDPAAPPHDRAARLHDRAAGAHDRAALPHDPAAPRHDPAAPRHDPAAPRHDSAARPHDPAGRPHDPAARPRGQGDPVTAHGPQEGDPAGRSRDGGDEPHDRREFSGDGSGGGSERPRGAGGQGSHPQGVPQAAHAGHTDGGKKFDAGNDPKYDRPVERQIEMEKTLPDHRKGGEGKDPTTVDPGSYTDHDRTGRGQDELDEGVGNRQGQPRERSVHALKRLFRWAHKINLFDGSRALKMNCAEITRRFCDVLNGDAPRVAKGNRFGTGEWHDVTLEHMGLADFPPENKFIRPAGHDGDFGVDHQAFQLVRDRLTGRPPGTHANIGVSFKKGGHRFAAFVDLDGSVKWFDGQVSEAARKLTDGSPEQLAAIMRDMVKDGSKLPLGVNIEHLEFAVREPGGHWEGPPRTAEHESAAVMRHRREEGQLRPSEPLDLDALPPSATMSVPEWFAAQAKHHASPATTEPSVWEQLQGEQSGHGSDDGAQRPEWQQEPDGRPSQWAPPRVDQRRYPAGPAAPGDPWGGAGDHWPQDFGPTGTPGGPGRFGPTGTPGGPGHFGPSGADGPGTFGPRGTDGPGSFGPGGTDGPGTFGPTGVVEPPRERWYEGVQPVAPGGRSTRTYHPSDWHPQGPWRSELADPNFRASKADGEALRRRYQPYSKRQLDEFRRRGRISLGEKEMAKLTDIDIQASELLLNDFVENMNRAFHLGDVRVEKHPVIRCAISAMHKMPNFTGTVHRGVRIRDPKGQQAFVDSHELGGTVRYKGFTHSDKNVAGGHRYEIMVHIESRFGKDMTYLRDPLQGIEEVIHLPHSDFYPVPVPPDWAHAPAGLDAGATKFQDADGRWHLFVRDHTGPYHPSEAMPPDPQPYPSFGPLGHDTGTYVDPQYGGPQQQGGYEHPQQDSAAPEDWVPGDADFGRTTKAGFDPAFHHKALGPEFAPRVNDPDGAFDGPERELADRLVEEGWQVDGRLEDTRVEGTKNPEAMVRRDPSDVGRITEFKTPSRYTRNALRNAIKAGSRQVPDVGGEVVVDGRGIGLLEVDARDAYRAAAGQRGDRLASQVHIILGDGRMLTFVKEQ